MTLVVLGETQRQCMQQLDPASGQSCVGQGGSWHLEGGSGTGGGIPGGFIALIVVLAVAGIALTIWKVGAARSMARESGLDPRRATAMTLLTDDGLDATYLASSLRAKPAPTPAPPAAPAVGSTGTIEQRLTALEELRRKGLLTEEEYAAKRATILDGL